ncbi:MAG: ATP synthase F1 subunit delta [Magnetococcales bacterium]|nr:ATP synthase F1 subunit delta [Magnetococcales bacterium]
MHESTLAKRYASALADLAAEEGSLDRVGTELDGFQELLRALPALERLLTSPTATREDQESALAAILEKGAPSALTSKFLRLLVHKGRMVLIESIITSFNRELEVRSGRMTVHVKTPMPLTQTHAKGLQTTLSKMTGKSVQLEIEEAPDLLGGMVIRMGSQMMDFSVRGRLERLQAQMRG